MIKTAQKQPQVFFATCARLIPQQVAIDLQTALPGNLSPSDWADLRELLGAIQQALPDVGQRSEHRQKTEHNVRPLYAGLHERPPIRADAHSEKDLLARRYNRPSCATGI
jgi:hypothetical protein